MAARARVSIMPRVARQRESTRVCRADPLAPHHLRAPQKSAAIKKALTAGTVATAGKKAPAKK